jgi:hypothetical protein
MLRRTRRPPTPPAPPADAGPPDLVSLDGATPDAAPDAAPADLVPPADLVDAAAEAASTACLPGFAGRYPATITSGSSGGLVVADFDGDGQPCCVHLVSVLRATISARSSS